MRRFLIALAFGVLAGWMCVLNLSIHPQAQAADLTWCWRGAQELLAGRNPYDDPRLGPGRLYPYDAPLFYPLPAVLLVIPLAPLPPVLAGGLFVGISSALLAWGVASKGRAGLLLFVSAPYWIALTTCQWSILLTAALLSPWLASVAVCKPNLGVAIVGARPSRMAFFGGAVLLLLSLLVLPSWPWDWARSVAQQRHAVPILILPFGVLLMAAAFRWRDARARLLLALALMPQRMLFYDQLALGLIPQTTRERLAWLILGWVAWLGWVVTSSGASEAALPWVLACVYLPSLMLLFRAAPRSLIAP